MQQQTVQFGEEQAWEILAKIDPEDVCRRAKVDFDKSCGCYVLKSFLQDIYISPLKKEITGYSSVSAILLNELEFYSRISILRYLINARGIPLAGELKKPDNMSGGLIFSHGTHALPLDAIANKYGSKGKIREFFRKGKELGGERLHYGDASLRLSPFPRIPVVIIVWKNDEEFPSRAHLLFDSTCEVHLPTDIIWATAMMSALIIL